MATSGTYTFTVTRDDIIREAMLNIGKIGQTESPTAQETTDCNRKLNLIVKQWMGKPDFAPGLKMWSRQRGDLFLSSTHGQYALGTTGDNWAGGIAVTQPNGNTYFANQLIAAAASGQPTLSFGVGDTSNYTAGDFIVVQLTSGDIFSSTILSINGGAGTVTMNANLPSGAANGNFVFNYTTKAQRPLQLVTAILRDTNNNDTPLDYMTAETYEQLPNKTALTFLSDPTAIYYEPQLTNGQLYLDCGGAQDVTKHLHIVYLRPIQDFNNPLDNPEYSQEWYRALCWGLSREICPMFNAVWTKEMESLFNDSVSIAREVNPETTEFYFQRWAGSPWQP
jgi:hypothetical protein